MVREPAVAGQFYPGNKESLLQELDNMIPDVSVSKKIDAVGAIVPHAGYMYSGPVAGEVYARLTPRDTYIILSPNHTGFGDRFACSTETWRTPLGDVDADNDLAAAIMNNTDLVTEDASAHMYEHSIEVQIPFIQKISPSAKIVPITVQHGHMKELKEVSEAIVSAVKKIGRNTIIIASSDMSHYEPRNIAKEKDNKAIQAVLNLDAQGLRSVVEENNISMCGYIPSVIMLMCANGMNAKKGELVKYADSGDETGDTSQVVGYAGMIVY